MDKEELLEEAKRRYPIGCIFDNSNLGLNCSYMITKHDFYISNGNLLINVGATTGKTSYTLYKQGNWAIVKSNSELSELTELPEKWCIKVTSENHTILAKWRLNGNGAVGEMAIGSIPHGWITSNCNGFWYEDVDKSVYTEITFDQFKRWVLKEPVEKTPKFEVGKWYHVTLSGKYYHYFKFEKIDNEKAVLDKLGYIANKNKWTKGHSIYLADITYHKELTDLQEIQQYLPSGHPDKIDEVPEYVEFITDYNDIRKGNILEVINYRNYEFRHYSGKRVVCSQLNRSNYYRPSTKEAYEAQFKKEENMAVKDLVEGEIYYGKIVGSGKIIFLPRKCELYNNTISGEPNRFSRGNNPEMIEGIRKATEEEAQWLRACIKADKFVSLEDSKKSESVEKWSKGTYVVVTKKENGVLLPKGSVREIIQFSGDCVKLVGDTLCTLREDKGQIKWFATKAEAEEFSKQLLNRVEPKYKIGDNIQSNEGGWQYVSNALERVDAIGFLESGRNLMNGTCTDVKYSKKHKTYFYKIGSYGNMFSENCITLVNEPKTEKQNEVKEIIPEKGKWYEITNHGYPYIVRAIDTGIGNKGSYEVIEQGQYKIDSRSFTSVKVIRELKSDDPKITDPLLEYAKKKYPVGTEVNSLVTPYKDRISHSVHMNTGEQLWLKGNIYNMLVHRTGEWAEVVSLPEKKTIKKESKLEEANRRFKVGMKGRSTWNTSFTLTESSFPLIENPSGYICDANRIWDLYDPSRDKWATIESQDHMKEWQKYRVDLISAWSAIGTGHHLEFFKEINTEMKQSSTLLSHAEDDMILLDSPKKVRSVRTPLLVIEE